MSGMRLTRDGQLALGLVSIVLVIALQTGNNLVYLVASVLVAVLALAPVLGTWNLRGLAIDRTLPAEFFATVDARGAFVLSNRRRWGTAVGVAVQELDHPASQAMVGAVEAGGQVYAPTGWEFEERGARALGELRLSSTWPFGLIECWRTLDRPAAVVVYPKPRPGLWTTETGDHGTDMGHGQSVGAFGDFSRLREYVPGDAIRSIHWRTTARMGRAVVVVRTGEGARQMVVRVADRSGPAWEAEIARATGQVLRAFHLGCAVGLHLPDRRLEPRDGGPWRRDLLEVLATLPKRHA